MGTIQLAAFFTLLLYNCTCTCMYCIAFLLFYHYHFITAFLTYSCQSRTNSQNPDTVPPVVDKVLLKVSKQRRHLNHSKRKNSFPYILLTKPAGMVELRKEVQNSVHIENQAPGKNQCARICDWNGIWALNSCDRCQSCEDLDT